MKLPVIKPRQAIKAFQRAGWYIDLKQVGMSSCVMRIIGRLRFLSPAMSVICPKACFLGLSKMPVLLMASLSSYSR